MSAGRCSQCGGELRRFAGGVLGCPRCTVRLAIDPGETPAGTPNETPWLGSTPAPPAADADDVDVVAGRYRLLEEVGEGGMGTVYRALQTEPVRREVAVKFVKLGMDTREVVRRFEAERQALALMDHPAIARVFDGGATPQGRPYFVMEYVRGVPITAYCDHHRLSTAERVRLFAEVCDGVQHAHQKGVIHRDLKPSNVLVTEQDGRPAPKVIDFGIAKAMDAGIAGMTLQTRLDQRVGTPEYMSPEQAEAGSLDVDTRTDVYSLGVMLYELLAGSQPFTAQDLGATSHEELLRRIRESEPLRPSTRANTLLRSVPELAHRRRTDPRGLRRQLKGDLDWIAMKAIEKDRDRRYGSPAELAADLRRFLDHQPVAAGPPSAAYRLRKLVRRHRLAVAAAALVAAAILVAVVGATTGLVRARRAESVAAGEAAKATAINRFLQEVLGSADPYTRLGRDVTVVEALAEAAGRIDRGFAEQPEIRAAVEDTIGNTYLRLGRFDDAEPLLRRALETRRALHHGDHPDVAASLASLARLERARNDLDAAAALQEEALAITRRLPGDRSAEIAERLHDQAWIRTDRADFAGAELLFEQSLALRRRLEPPAPLAVAESLQGLAGAKANQGDYAAAEALYREALDTRERLLGTQHLEVAQSQSSLGLTLQVQGELDRAEPLLRQALATRRELLGDRHPDTADSMNSLAGLYAARGDGASAEALYLELLPTLRGLYGEAHPNIARTLHNLGSMRRDQGDLEGAERYYLEALAMNRSISGPDHATVGIVLYNLASVSLDRGRPAVAEDRLRESIGILEKSLPADHWRLATAKGRLGEALTVQGRYAEAEPLLLASWPPIRDARGAGSAAGRDALRRLVELYRAWGREDEAERWEREAVSGEATAGPS